MRDLISSWLSPYLPDYDTRPQQPRWHLPLMIAICIGSCTAKLDGTVRVVFVFPIVSFLAFTRIVYTTGSISDDYFVCVITLLTFLSFTDHMIIGALQDRQARLLNSPKGPRSGSSTAVKAFKNSGIKGVALEDCVSYKERFYWACALLSSWRGVGWNWQVAKIPSNRDIGLTNRQAAYRHLTRVVKLWIRRSAEMYLINFSATLRTRNSEDGDGSLAYTLLIEIIFIWSCQTRIFDSSKMLYSTAAAITTFLGICSPSEWPPLFGKVGNAWSVRRTWGQVWHQSFRRTFEVYSGLLVSALGVKKGTFASRYTKLYGSFFISFVLHAWYSFCAGPDEMGNFRFFMSQAVIITIEDFVRFVWRETGGRKHEAAVTRFEKMTGYIWTFVWFTYISHEVHQIFFEKGLIHPETGLEETLADLARAHALLLLQS
ncbi:Acetyltransferase sirH [Pseudocercospora fuligena]|uniref:Acetyltransferase sirH n=1 Tax=Pseudocercospora fuligena TaxID=685502 RepID=A0A8H6RPX0_9PEZI|nr:Acetyltransferase sirH [Pseudocercospora fuligena]